MYTRCWKNEITGRSRKRCHQSTSFGISSQERERRCRYFFEMATDLRFVCKVPPAMKVSQSTLVTVLVCHSARPEVSSRNQTSPSLSSFLCAFELRSVYPARFPSPSTISCKSSMCMRQKNYCSGRGCSERAKRRMFSCRATRVRAISDTLILKDRPTRQGQQPAHSNRVHTQCVQRPATRM